MWEGTHSGFDYAGRRVATHAGVTRAHSQLGIGSNFPSTANNKWTFPLRDDLHNTNVFTYVAMFSAAWGSSKGICGMFVSPSRYTALFLAVTNAIDWECYVSPNSARTARTAVDASYFDGTPTCVVATCDVVRNDVYAAKPLTLAGYSAGANGAPGTRNSVSTEDFAVGNYQAASGGGQWNGDILFLAYLPGIAWSAEQAKAWMRDPYGPIRQRRRVWARVPAAGGDVRRVPSRIVSQAVNRSYTY